MQFDGVPAGAVVVGVDGSDASRPALHWAVDQARAEGLALVVVHAVGPVGTHQDAPLQEGQRILDEARAEARRSAPALEVRDLLRVADPRDLLIALTHRAACLVVGSRAPAPVVESLPLGSVGVAVVRHSTCPVVVVRPGDQPLEHDGILVGVEAWGLSSGLLDFAYRQASQRRLPLTLLHTYLPTHPKTEPAEQEERLRMADVLSDMQEEYPDVTVRYERMSGPAGERLLQMSAGMDLVVVGTTAGGPAFELLFGSIAAFLVEHATCPVAVVPVRTTPESPIPD